MMIYGDQVLITKIYEIKMSENITSKNRKYIFQEEYMCHLSLKQAIHGGAFDSVNDFSVLSKLSVSI